jgi:diguanylate cyclase (GGDEF)-like protein
MDKRFTTKIDKNLCSVFLVVLLLIGMTLLSIRLINQTLLNSCQNLLDDTALKLADDIKINMQNNHEELEIAAKILAANDTMNDAETKELLTALDNRGFIDTLAVLLPDNTFLTFSDTYRELSGTLDFAEEVKKGRYLAERHVLPSTQENYIYDAIPIVKDGNTVGILYGFINLKALTKFYSPSGFGNFVHYFIVNGQNGNFLLDTWHESLGNLNDDYYAKRMTKDGTSFDELRYNLKNKIPGRLTYRSEKQDTYFYTCYYPIGIYSWAVILTIPEDIALSYTSDVSNNLFILKVSQVLILTIYLMLFLYNVIKQNKYEQYQLTKALYMFDVQETLFTAHQKPEQLTCALSKVADKMHAASAFLIPLHTDSELKYRYIWPEKNLILEFLKNLKANLPSVADAIRQGRSVIYDAERKNMYYDDTTKFFVKLSIQEKLTLQTYHIKNFAIAPVADAKHIVRGILGTVNMDMKRIDASFLECICHNFMMALANLNSQQVIIKMGTVDSLTGLKNRNSYNHLIEEHYSSDKNRGLLSCVYIDVNGLHDLNNRCGHAAGDEMLRFIADAIKNVFPPDNAYRIGGDEFVVFLENAADDEAIKSSIAELRRICAARDYNMAVGFASQEMPLKVDELIAEAETNMYDDKKDFYKKQGNLAKARIANCGEPKENK